jgi:hypothetical protein
MAMFGELRRKKIEKGMGKDLTMIKKWPAENQRCRPSKAVLKVYT